jgi:hypothetical protein
MLPTAAGAAEHPPGEAFTVNHGARQVLDALLPRLADGGFGLISDYAAEPGIDAQQQSFQRFGPVCAIGLNRRPWKFTTRRRLPITAAAMMASASAPAGHWGPRRARAASTCLRRLRGHGARAAAAPSTTGPWRWRRAYREAL